MYYEYQWINAYLDSKLNRISEVGCLLMIYIEVQSKKITDIAFARISDKLAGLSVDGFCINVMGARMTARGGVSCG